MKQDRAQDLAHSMCLINICGPSLLPKDHVAFLLCLLLYLIVYNKMFLGVVVVEWFCKNQATLLYPTLL